jgi:hypothetical protein
MADRKTQPGRNENADGQCPHAHTGELKIIAVNRGCAIWRHGMKNPRDLCSSFFHIDMREYNNREKRFTLLKRVYLWLRPRYP